MQFQCILAHQLRYLHCSLMKSGCFISPLLSLFRIFDVLTYPEQDILRQSWLMCWIELALSRLVDKWQRIRLRVWEMVMLLFSEPSHEWLCTVRLHVCATLEGDREWSCEFLLEWLVSSLRSGGVETGPGVDREDDCPPGSICAPRSKGIIIRTTVQQ